jgi:hypothetical protein|nr:hypothetical protein [Kofleriaceae bacterium]
MTTTEETLTRLRRFEWACARDEHAREVHDGVRKRSHDLLNLVQIVDLASQQLVARCGEAAAELASDLSRAALEAREAVQSLAELAAKTSPPLRAERTSAGAVARCVLTRGTISVDDSAVIAWSPEELQMLLLALELDAPHGELIVRSRAIEDGHVVEVVCGPIEDGALAVRMARAIATHAGGDVTTEPRRGGGYELAVTIPATK